MEKFDGSQNPIEFLQIYTTAVRAAIGGEHVMANYLPTVLEGSARSWLLNQPQESIYSWQRLCDLVLANFLGTYNFPGKKDDLHSDEDINSPDTTATPRAKFMRD